MGWTINSIPIIVTGEEKTAKKLIARLQPVQGGTILQFFGYDSPIHQIEARVVGVANLAALEALVNTSTAYALVGYNFSKNLYVSTVRSHRDEVVYQTLDTTQNCESPVYTVSLELYE